MTYRSAKIASWLLALISAGCTFLMYQRQAQNELWGHWPLIQFSSLLLLVVLLLKRRYWSDKVFWKKIGLATLSALFLSIGFPPFPLPLFLFIGFVPLLLAVHQGDKKCCSDFFLLYFTFLLWNIFTTYWVANTAYFGGVFANTVNALLMVLPILAYLFIVRKLGAAVGLVAFVVCWISFEFLHMRWELHWPWLTLGNGLAKMPFAVQWYSFTGALGGSAWILIVNYMLYRVYLQRENWAWKKLTRPALWLILPTIFSLAIYVTYQEKGVPLELVSVQSDFESNYQKSRLPQQQKLEKCLALARAKITPSTDYVVLPETLFSRVDLNQPLSSPIVQALRDFARENNLRVVLGISAYRFLEDSSEIRLPTTRSIVRQNGNIEYVEQYNSAIQLDAYANIQEYYKALYVPGAEFFPFRKVLFFLKPLVDQLGGTISGYRVREEFNIFTAPDDTKIAPAICYESIFGEFITRFVQKGANLILVMTDDGWWDNTAGHRQHADFARLRAIECRRDVVRSANMGTCCRINQRGEMSQETVYGEASAINVKALKNNDLTFYTQWGDMIGRLSLFMTILLFARSLVSYLPGKNNR